MTIAVIGNGAISKYVQRELAARDLIVAALIVRPGKEAEGCVTSVAELSEDVDLLVDCAGHPGLQAHGAAALRRGIDVVTLSLGALADAALQAELATAAEEGGARLHLASGAIGALDALRAGAVGPISHVTYVGRKPPRGWKGSPAERACDLDTLHEPFTHFTGTAREAAVTYPKNANVAAAVALSSIGLDATQVELIADPSIAANIHEVRAEGGFGRLHFTLEGNSLPDNPRSSALAAMSAVAAVLERQKPVGF